MSRWILVVGLLAGAVICAFLFGPGVVEASMNRVTNRPPYSISNRARAIIEKQGIVDLHADSLLWGRNLAERSSRGQVDIPRLAEAGVALQAFTVVTKTPRGQNFQRNSGDTDNIQFLALLERWPLDAYRSLAARALHQAARLAEFERRSNGAFRIVRSRADLAQYLEARRGNPKLSAGFLGIEGAQALDGRLENVKPLYDAGFRMMSPSHFYDTEFGGSSAGVEKGGLTEDGKRLVARMESMSMLVDLAHAAPKTIDDVLAIATRPVVVSHTGVKGTCDTVRNLSDDHLRAIARNGGLIGIAYFDFAVCGKDAAAVARAILHAAQVAGVEHVALGSDFDGAVETPFDTTGVGLIADALLASGMSENDVAQVMGRNALRFLAAQLP